MKDRNDTATGSSPEEPDDAAESLAFWTIALALGPVAAVVIVGGYGFVVWMSHLLTGPPAG